MRAACRPRPVAALPTLLYSGAKATWRSGYATVCKTVYTGSIPVVASNLPISQSDTVYRRHEAELLQEAERVVAHQDSTISPPAMRFMSKPV